MLLSSLYVFNAPATTQTFPLSLPDALPISVEAPDGTEARPTLPSSRRTSTSTVVLPRESRISRAWTAAIVAIRNYGTGDRSEEHTSELQSRGHLVCRLLLEKKK